MLSKVVIVGALFRGEGSLLKRAQDSAASSVKRIVQAPRPEMTAEEKEEVDAFRNPFVPKPSGKPLACDIANYGQDLEVIKVNYTAAIDAGNRNYNTYQPMGCHSLNLEDPAVKIVEYEQVVPAEKHEKMTPSRCFGFAASICGAQFFAIKNGNKCYALTAFTPGPSSNGNCRAPCAGEPGIRMCGSDAVPFLFKMVHHKDSKEELEDSVRYQCKAVSFLLSEAESFAKDTGIEMIASTNCASKSGSLTGDSNPGVAHTFALDSTRAVIGKMTQGAAAVQLKKQKDELEEALKDYVENFGSSNPIQKEEKSRKILDTCRVNSDTMGTLQDTASIIKGFGTYNQLTGSYHGCFTGMPSTQRVSGPMPVSLNSQTGLRDMIGGLPLDFYLQTCKDAKQGGFKFIACQGAYCDCVDSLPINGKSPTLCEGKVTGSSMPSGNVGLAHSIIEIGGPPASLPLDQHLANVACKAGEAECAAEDRNASTTCKVEKQDLLGVAAYKTHANCQRDCQTDPSCVGLQIYKGHGGGSDLVSCTRFQKFSGLTRYSSATETCSPTKTQCYVKKVMQNMIKAAHRNVFEPEVCYTDQCDAGTA